MAVEATTRLAFLETEILSAGAGRVSSEVFVPCFRTAQTATYCGTSLSETTVIA